MDIMDGSGEEIKTSEMINAVYNFSPDDMANLLDKGVDVNSVLDEEGNTALHLASVTDRNLPCVRLLVERGANVNARNKSLEMTPLHVASYHGSSENVKFLISNNGLVDCQDIEGFTPLHNAAQGIDNDKYNIIMEVLLNAGAQVLLDSCGKTFLYFIWVDKNAHIINMYVEKRVKDIIDEQGNTLLHYAAREGNISIVELLLNKGRLIDEKNVCGQTALHMAAKLAHAREPSVVNLLIERGADMNIKDFQGETALSYAIKRVLVEKRSPEVLDLLIIYGVTRENINSKGSVSGQPLLHTIIECIGEGRINKDGGTVLFEMLLKAGAKVNDVDNAGNTALHIAVLHKDNLIVQKLLKTDIDVNLKNVSGRSAYHLALDLDNNMPYLFLGRTALINCACPSTGDMLLHKAVRKKLTDYLQQLVPMTTNLNHKNHDRMSALYLAALGSYGIGIHILLANEIKYFSKEYNKALFITILKKNKELLNKLLNNVCDVNVKDSMGRSPLHWAVLRRFSHGVGSLLTSGADVNAKDTTGSTALHYAVLVDKQGILEVLLSSGADLNILNEDKRSALHLASYVKKGNSPRHRRRKGDICGHATVERLAGSGGLLNLKDCHGNTPLHLATMNDNLSAVDSLLNWEARVDIRNERGEFCISSSYMLDSRSATICLANYFLTVKKAKLVSGNHLQFLFQLNKCIPHLRMASYFSHSQGVLIKKCARELKAMVDFKIGDISLYNVFFVKSSSYLFNSHLKSAIFSTSVRDEFPIYGRMLRNRIKKYELWKGRLNESVGFQLKTVTCGGSEVYLPVDVKFIIFSFLSDEDLDSIIRASY